MSVEGTQSGHQIRYELRHGAALVALLIFGQPEIEAVDAQPPLTSGWEPRPSG
jgi:hypothetical protein